MEISLKTSATDYMFIEIDTPNLTINVNGIEVYSGNRLFDTKISTIIRYAVRNIDSVGRVTKIEKGRNKTFLSWLQENNALVGYIHEACHELPLSVIKDIVMLNIYLELNKLERKDYSFDGYMAAE